MGKLPYVRLLRYGSAFVAVIVTLIIALILRPVLEPHIYSVFYVPIIVVALYAGFGPGLLTILLCSGCIDYFFLTPNHTFGITDSQTGLQLAIFVLMGVLLNVLSSSRYNIEGLFVRQDESFRTILASVGDAVITTDLEGRIRFVNSVAEQLTGWTLEAARGKHLTEVFKIINEYNRQPVQDPVQRVLREGTVVGLANHTILITRSGAERPIDDSAAPIRTTEGQPSGAVLIFRDISQRRKMETEQKERQRLESYLAAIVESSDDAIISKDLNAIITSWNQGAERMYFFTAEETIGKPIYIIIPPGLESDVPYILDRIKRGEHVDHYETRRVRKDGVVLDVSLTVSPIYDDQGTIIGASKIARDITERKRTEERNSFLATASDVLGSSLDYEATLASIARLAVPNMADWCSVDMLQEDGTLKRLAVAHIDPEKVAWAYELSKRYPVDMNAQTGVPQVIRSGQPQFLPDIPDSMLVAAAKNAEELDLMRKIGFTSAMTVPLIIQGRGVGAIGFVSAESGRHYTDSDLAFAQELARRAAIAVENARLYSQAQQARQTAEALAERTLRLQRVTAALAALQVPEQVAQTVIKNGMEAAAAYGGIVLRRSEDQHSLEIIAQEGYPPTGTNTRSSIPLTDVTPATEAIRSGQALFIEGHDDLARRFPDIFQTSKTQSLAALPLNVHEQIIGVLVFSFADSRTFSPEDRVFMLSLAQQASLALERSRLFNAEQTARQQAEAVQKRLRFLAEVSSLLASSLNYQETLATLARLAVPELGDWCGVDILQEDGSLQRLAVEHVDPEKVALAYELRKRYPFNMDEPGNLQTALRTGQSVLIPDIPDEMLVATAIDEEQLEITRKIGFSSAMIVPLIAHERTLGAITLVAAESGRHYTNDDLTYVQEVARRAAQAVDNARLYGEVNQQRERFQTTLASIGDGVITTDTEGRVTLVNAVAANLMGLTPEEAIGKPLEEIFHIVNQITRQSVENPVRRVLREGIIVGLANHTVLLSRLGIEIPISDSGAPIRDAQGNLLGVVLVFRDDTERQHSDAIRRQLASIVEFSDDAIIAEDLHGNITTWNAAAERMYGYTSEEIIGQPISVLVPSDCRDELNNVVNALNHGEHVSHFESVRLHKDGTRIDVSITLSPLKDEEGKITGYSKIARDIREQKRIREELRASNEQLEVIFKNIGSGITVQRPDGRVIFANDIAATMTGYSSVEDLIASESDRVTGRFTVTDEAGIPLAPEQMTRAEALRTKQSVEKIMGYHDLVGGEEHWSIVKSTPILDDQGNIQLLVNFIQDITELKRIQKRLQLLSEVGTLVSSSLDYETMLAQLAHLLVPVLADNYVLDVVQEDGSLERVSILAATPEAEDAIREYAEHYPPDPNAQSIRRALRSGEAILIPDFPASIQAISTNPEHASLIQTFHARSIMAIPLVVRDKVFAVMTLGCINRPYTEDDLQLAKEIAWRAAQAVDNARLYAQTQQINMELERRVTERTAELEAFSYSVSHDLRAPLRAINGFSRMLVEDYEESLPPDARHYLDTIGSNAQQMGKLIDALLAFSRLGRQALAKSTVNTTALVREVIAGMRDDWQGRDIDFVIENLPLVEADATLLKQVFVNLLSNAIKFTRHREKTRIEIGSQQQGGQTVYFVRDNGVGFNMDYVNKLFGVFQRLHRLDEYEGIGVGLALVQRIIQRHGGRIWADAEPDKGATFYFTLDAEANPAAS